ncbi:RNA exonuclease 5 [Aphis craccivora]|uniref:RNA exonuclease 5 n=1 Tax=Aphis craccivora TaxID=307492 RepID=A0A6G0ZNR7_APHCR|nr:RNA exonuclease 5 [Aphis craccivora]
MSAKRKLTDKSSSPSAQPVVKYKRTCQQPANKSTNDTLTKEEYLKLKLYLKEKKKILKTFPRILLNARGHLSQLNESGFSECPLLPTDLNELILYSVYGPGKYVPKWSSLEMQCNLNQTCVLIIDGCEVKTKEDLSNFNNSLPMFSKYKFLPPIEVELPPSWCADNDTDTTTSITDDIASESPLIEKENVEKKEICSRTRLLMSLNQMMIHNYPLPTNKRQFTMDGFRFTKSHYLPVTDDSPMFAIDCEMCYTSIGRNELTRVSIVNEQLDVIYESFVKPSNKITNYLTVYSGITASKLKNVKTTLADVQEDIIKLLTPDSILIGQSLNCDLDALKLFHPYIIDTSVIFNLNGNKGCKSKLKLLAKYFLDMNIQCGNLGHDSIEDSRATMLLVQLKLCKSLTYGDAYLIGQKRLAEFVNKKTKINVKHIETFKKFLALLQSVSESSAKGDYHFNIKITSKVHLKKNLMAAYDNIFSTSKLSIEEHSTNKVVLESVCKSMEDTTNRFCMAHMQLKNKNNLDLVNRWCEKYWAAMSSFALCAVLFTGCGAEGKNSVCLLNVKQPPLNHLQDKF